jgi:YfiH family protein
MEWQERDGLRWLRARMPAATAAFSTRMGGTGSGPFESLNLGLLTGDQPAVVRANRARLADALDREAGGMLIGHQVHGTRVLRRERPPEPNPYAEEASPPRADGQATADPGLTPVVQVADCLPVALAGAGAVAMIHCGWRGLANGIIEHGVEEVGAVAAAIGPGIGPCCYEVGEQVLARFEALGDGVAGGRMLDLSEVARRLLGQAGVVEIESADICTSCEPELFFSHRRDGPRTGRQGGLAWIDSDA